MERKLNNKHLFYPIIRGFKFFNLNQIINSIEKRDKAK